MSGYLDNRSMNPTVINISGLPQHLSYDVYVYIMGGVNGRG